MELFDKIIQTLRKPFPEQEYRATYFQTVIGVSVFVTAFLYIFRPFDLSIIESGEFLICLGFGFITFISILLYDFVISPIDASKTFIFLSKTLVFV